MKLFFKTVIENTNNMILMLSKNCSCFLNLVYCLQFFITLFCFEKQINHKTHLISSFSFQKIEKI